LQGFGQAHGDEVFILDDEDVPGAGARRSASEFWRPAPHRCVEMQLNWRRRHASGSLSWRQCAEGLRNRLRHVTDIGQPRVVLSLSCLTAGNEDFQPRIYNSRREFKSGGKFFI
jgi:hypothetical protein